MLRISVQNPRERQHLEHAAGPIELGRGPRRNGVPRCIIQDAYVSKDHVRIEEIAAGELRIENLSAKQPIVLSTGHVHPGAHAVLRVPARLGIGETVIDIEFAIPDADEEAAFKTVLQPLRSWGAPDMREALRQVGGAPTPELLTRWFEAVVAVQRSSPASPEYYDQTARALVELLGMDTGLVLLRQGDAWRVAARAFRDEGVPGREFSLTILNRVVAERRTFFQSKLSGGGSQSESLSGVLSVVASPVSDLSDEVVGAVYATRARSVTGREIGPLEAQLVQVLASAVTAGLARLEQDMRASQMRAAKEAAEAVARAKGQFLANMSHELRTPLNAIIGYSEMVAEMMSDDGVTDYVADLAKVTRAGKHLLALINDILDISKIAAGKMPLNFAPFDLGALVEEVASTVETLAKKNGNTLAVQMPPDGLNTMHADVTRVRQALLNLLSNACKFTKQGTITLSGERHHEAGRDWVSLRVSDTGIGIPLAKQETLFEEFEQAGSHIVSEYGGTGLGLAISRRFCRMMGGDITLSSEMGKGSHFTIWLPAHVETQSSATEAPPLPALAHANKTPTGH